MEVETAIVQSLLNGITTELRKKLITLLHLADDEADDNFHLIKECNRAMVLSLLSLLLPNLESISSNEYGCSDYNWPEALALIMMSQLPWIKPGLDALTKLSEIRVIGWTEGNLDRGFSNERSAFTPFMQLPSIRSLIGTSVRDNEFTKLEDHLNPWGILSHR